MAPAELRDFARILYRSLRLASGVKFSGIPIRKAVRITSGNVMLIETIGCLENLPWQSEIGGKGLRKNSDGMPPRFPSPVQNKGFQGFFGALLCGKCCPLEVAVLQGMFRMSEIPKTLIPPILPSVHSSASSGHIVKLILL
jgi:hypothetical protein